MTPFKLIILISGICLLTLALAIGITYYFGLDTLGEKFTTGVFSLLAVSVPIIIQYVSKVNKQNSQSEGLKFAKSQNSYDIFIYGFSGSGKSTLIQRQFTLDTLPLKSTKQVDYYSVQLAGGLKDIPNNNYVALNIADYKGQDVTQLHEAAKENPFIDALLIIADLAPAYNDEGEKMNSDTEVLDYVSSDFNRIFYRRIDDQRHKYLSEFALQPVIKYVLGNSLKSIRFVINKVDLLEQMVKKGLLTINTDSDSFAIDLYSEPIQHLKNFCKANDIEDFKVEVISVTQLRNTKEMFADLIREFNA
ncbi:MAG: GTPase domain-containing protein [Roseivirga sp.]|nr:GTPase domain-containing protein [Roseivirga sp.]